MTSLVKTICCFDSIINILFSFLFVAPFGCVASLNRGAVSIPGEVRSRMGGQMCNLSWTPNSEINHSCVSHRMGCLEHNL